MICPTCGSDDLRLRNYDSYTDELVYECMDCESIIRRCDTTTNKSVTADKIDTNARYICPKCGSVMHHKDGQVHCEKCEKDEISSVNSTIKICFKCGGLMTLQTDGSFICSKCGLVTFPLTSTSYDDSKMTVSKSSLPNELKIVAEKITIVDKTIGVQIDISKQILDNTDTIVINGVKYIKETK